MHFTFADLAAFAGFFALVIGLALWKSRRAKGHATDSSDFFLAGRNLTWPLIGISIVAANISTEQMVGMAGQAAGATGLAVSAWQLIGSVGIVVVAVTLLPRFLRAGIYTMPEFLEYRYNPAARAIMAVLTVLIYAVVMLPAVLYSGGVTLRAIAGVPLVPAVCLIAAIGMVYSACGGLKAIAWADLVQGLALLAAGLLVLTLGLAAIGGGQPGAGPGLGRALAGGWQSFTAANAAKLHMVLPADNPDLPWTGVLGGMWIVLIYYCGLNQFIVQRNLAARTLRDGQLGMVFAGALWLLVPFAIVIPGLISQQLYGDRLGRPDEAFPTLVRELVRPGLRGAVYAAIAGAVTSTLASLLNSASTIATMDVWRRLVRPGARQGELVWLGRALTVLFVAAGCAIAPALDDPRFGGVFQFIQQFQGYIWPGVVAAFVFAFVLPRAPGSAGVVALVGGPLLYALFQFLTRQGLFGKVAGAPLFAMHFLLQVLCVFLILAATIAAMAAAAPLPAPRRLPVRADLDLRTATSVKVAGTLVILAVAAFHALFW